ncbi:adenosine deaminase [Apiospora aurea]|uniref:Adenine deaminase n=1 Tax=Apiospora aurea TaxID=335848 RepID=A0ABR1Q7X7_9PEZI
MCQTALHPFLEALPKCEHHMHIEGSLEPELLFELAAKNGVALPSPAADPAYASVEALRKRYEAFTGLDDFLGYYYVAMSALVDASDFARLAEAYFRRAASQNVRHAEVFFDPQAHSARGVALATGARGARVGVSSVLIMCVLRHLPPAEGVALFEEAREAGYFVAGGGSDDDASNGKDKEKKKEPVLGGIGLDSSEKPFPPELWTELYGAAKKAGVRRTAHAGEEGPAQYIVDSLDMLDAQRIDHGLRAVLEGDEGVTEALLERLVEQKIMLTLCPLSNVRLRCLESVKDFPLRKLLDRGVRFSINSDDPAYFGGYILENYCALQDAFNLSMREWESVAKGAVMGSWCADRRKWEILSEIEALTGGVVNGIGRAVNVHPSPIASERSMYIYLPR